MRFPHAGLPTFLSRSALALFLSAIAIATPSSAQEAKARAEAKFFPYKQAWLGADSAYSIPLGRGKSVWLFGDTFVEIPGHAPRNLEAGFIRNSIAISTCVEQNCKFEYYWPGIGTTHPQTMFALPGADWFWPLDGFVYKHTLYIAFVQMKAEGSGAFGFAFGGAQMAVIKNYEAAPAKWKITYQKLNAGATAIPGVTITIPSNDVPNPDPQDARGANYAYFFTLVPNKGATQQHMSMTRIALKKLSKSARPGASWEYLRADHTWAKWPGSDSSLPADHATVFAPGATEMTVRYHAATKKWLGVFPSGQYKQAMYMSAPSLLGPWSEPNALYAYPEMQPSNSNYTPHVFCYAAKEHVELEKPDQLFFTYACNSTEIPEVLKNTNLYYPVVVTQPLPH
jgi:hypothetical protein